MDADESEPRLRALTEALETAAKPWFAWRAASPHQALLLLLKDTPERLPLTLLLRLGRALQAVPPVEPLLLGLHEARLVAALAVATQVELAALSPSDLAYLRAAVGRPGASEAIVIAGLLALAAAADPLSQGIAAHLQAVGATAKVREAAAECLLRRQPAAG